MRPDIPRRRKVMHQALKYSVIKAGDHMKKLAFIIALVAAPAFAFVANPAAAQTTSSNCRMTGNTWHCDSQTQERTKLDASIISSPSEAYSRLPSINDQIEQRHQIQQRRDQELTASYARSAQILAEQRANLAREESADRHSKVGRMLATGDCAGALALSLNSGDIELANQVKAYCSPAPGTPSPTP